MENKITCMKDKCIASQQEKFVAACWAFKRRHRTEEPTAHEFGIPWSLSEALARQVQKEFEQQVLRNSKARAA